MVHFSKFTFVHNLVSVLNLENSQKLKLWWHLTYLFRLNLFWAKSDANFKDESARICETCVVDTALKTDVATCCNVIKLESKQNLNTRWSETKLDYNRFRVSQILVAIAVDNLQCHGCKMLHASFLARNSKKIWHSIRL